jgi:tRNA dimethylallyltransferase
MAPLIVITGPTASGKSALALELAERYNGEIVCADSRTIYKGMDIGTAKPSNEDQARVPHHLLDVAMPGERYTLYDFQEQARMAIADIRRRGKVPFLVGGTGLYIDSIVLDFELSGEPDQQMRSMLESQSLEELQSMIKKQHITMPTNSLNKRHLVRAIEQSKINTISRDKPDNTTYVVAIATSKDELEKRISDRAREMFQSGVLDEARQLGEKYGWDSEAMTGNIYPILHEVIEGRLTEAEAIETIIIRDRQLVKRQLTWLKRHDYVKWFNLEDARVYLEDILRRSHDENVLT